MKIKEKEIQRIIASNTAQEASKIILNMFQQKTDSEIIEINSLEDAIKYIGEKDEDVIDYHKTVTAGIAGHCLRYIELVIIIKAVNKFANGGKLWIPDWDNAKEGKWWLWWNMKTSGFGVSATTYVTWHTAAAVGSRLCFLTEKLALNTSKLFLPKFKEFLTIKK
jgi:hypothetical protein